MINRRHCTHTLTLSAARILKEAMTWSAVSVSVVSVDMKSMKAWKVTAPLPLGSTMPMMRANSLSPWQPRDNRLTKKRQRFVSRQTQTHTYRRRQGEPCRTLCVKHWDHHEIDRAGGQRPSWSQYFIFHTCIYAQNMVTG